MNKDTNAKVQRWKIAVQDYNFDIAYLIGELNSVADSMSRFCPHEQPEETEINSLTIYQLLDDIREVNNTTNDTFYYTDTQERMAYYVTEGNILDFSELYSLVSDSRRPHLAEQIHKIISKCHNSQVGHFGVETTLTMIVDYLTQNPEVSRDLHWETKRQDIKTFIKKCPCCQKMNQKKLESYTNKYSTSTFGIFENLSIDVLHLPKTYKGNKYLLVIIDSFTRFVKLYPIQDLTAKAAVDRLVEFMCTFSTPNFICTDNASQFEEIFQETLRLLNIQNYKIQPYSHEENSIVERSIKEVQRHLRNIVYEEKIKNEWDTVHFLVERILNAKVSLSTGVAPADLVFAGQVDLNGGILFPRKSSTQQENISEYIKNITAYQELLLTRAYATQDATDSAHMARATNNQPVTVFPIRSYVLVQPENGPTDKLSPRLLGPYQIIEKYSRKQGDVYECQHLATNKIESFHVKLLTEYKFDDSSNLIDAATHDSEYFLVEMVLNHRFKNKDKSTKNLELLIKWVGNDLPEWQPYSTTLKKVEKVHDYLYNNRLATHVPTAFKRAQIIEENPYKRVRFDEFANLLNNQNSSELANHEYNTRKQRRI